MLRSPGDILITTPESLYLMLSSRVREHFSTTQLVIVDEVHVMAGTKRGAHLALTFGATRRSCRRGSSARGTLGNGTPNQRRRILFGRLPEC